MNVFCSDLITMVPRLDETYFIEYNQRAWTQVMTTLDSPLLKHKLLTRHGTMGQELIFYI